MKSLEQAKSDLRKTKDFDRDSLRYYADEYNKLKDLSVITLVISDFEGNKTKYHSLNAESLICLIDLYERSKAE